MRIDAIINELAAELPEVDRTVIANLAHRTRHEAGALVELLKELAAQQGLGEPIGAGSAQLRSWLLTFWIAIRFARWEENGIRTHLDAGLPSSSQLLQIIGNHGSSDGFPAYAELLFQQTEVAALSLLYTLEGDEEGLYLGMSEIQDEDRLLDVIAEFLFHQINSER